MSKESLHVLVVINIFWNVFGKAGTGITLILMNYHSMIQVVTNIVEGTVQKKTKFPLRIFSVNVTKSTVSGRFGCIY